jgi:pyruvate kinase
LSISVDINHDQSTLAVTLADLLAEMDEVQQSQSALIGNVHPSQRASAINLQHYLWLSQRDITSLQKTLHINGFSTLAKAEGYVKSQLNAIAQHLGAERNEDVPCDYFTSRQMLRRRSRQVFGSGHGTVPAIMVTFKTSFAHDFMMVKKLLKAGMNVARINCAHDDENTWLRMVKTVRQASDFTGIPCKIYMDLAGPKMRTRIRNKKNRIRVEEEDSFILTSERDFKSKLDVVECDIPGLADRLQAGDRVLFDDGIIEAVVTKPTGDGVELEVTRVSSKKPFLKNEKGINFPDSRLRVPALSKFDRDCIPFVKKHADMVGFSFIKLPSDVEEMYQALGDDRIPVVLKIETPDAWRHLPELLITAMRRPVYAVMIARGDLAVEIGFENISRAQEQIINLCRAAHAPVIYATQVLETMNKKGLPTRAEITDAAYGIHADCVMLNKGEHTVKAVKILRSILNPLEREL